MTFDKGIDDLMTKIEEAVKDGLEEFCEDMVKIIRPITPYDKKLREGHGQLERSIKFNVEKNKAFIIADAQKARDVDYALKQHENEEYSHLPGRTHHYITRPLVENNEKLLIILREKLEGIK